MVATVALSVPPILARKNTARSECRQEVAMLTDVAVRNAKPKEKPFKLAD
jgi:hypothetical protein